MASFAVSEASYLPVVDKHQEFVGAVEVVSVDVRGVDRGEWEWRCTLGGANSGAT